MSSLSPFLMVPQFQERPWGARTLAPIYSQPVGASPIGEVWLTGDDCRIAIGPLRGRALADVTREFGRALVGEASPSPDRFPLLIKFLFPKEKLSVQVHPDDETARRAGLPCGKTECWYVVGAEKGAQVALGLKPGTTRAELEQAIRETRAEQLLNWVDVHAGEMIYVAAGTVHTIGPGMILLETQQNSDTTYRLYDYGRPRPLHVKEGLGATRETTRAGKVVARGSAERQTLVGSPCFVVERHKLGDGTKKPAREEFVRQAKGLSVEIVVATRGCGVVEAEGHEAVTFACGDAVVIPAALPAFSIRAQWEVEFLRMALPAAGAAEPDTYLEATTSSQS